MNTQKNILNTTNTTNTNTNTNTNEKTTTKKPNAKNEYIKTLKNSNMINYVSYNKNKQLKQNTIDFINSIFNEKTSENATQTRVVKISNEIATYFKNEILIDFTSTLFYNKLKNINFENLAIKKIISTALLNNFKTTIIKIDKKQTWTIDNTTFETTTSNYKFLCDVCHRLAVYIDTQNKLAK